MTTILFRPQWVNRSAIAVSVTAFHTLPIWFLFNKLFTLTSKKKLFIFCEWNTPGPMTSPHKWPVMRQAYPYHGIPDTKSLWQQYSSERLFGSHFVSTCTLYTQNDEFIHPSPDFKDGWTPWKHAWMCIHYNMKLGFYIIHSCLNIRWVISVERSHDISI